MRKSVTYSKLDDFVIDVTLAALELLQADGVLLQLRVELLALAFTLLLNTAHTPVSDDVMDANQPMTTPYGHSNWLRR